MKIKYRDAKYLCKYDLELDFFKRTELKINDLWPTRNIYVLDTTEGKKILKMVNYTEKRLNFIVKMLNIVKESYNNVISYHKFSDGKYYTDWKGNRYIILDLINGGECNIYNSSDVVKATKALAGFHKATIGIEEKLTNIEIKESPLGELLNQFMESKKNFIKYKELAESKVIKNEFDEIFLSNFQENIDKINRVIELLKNSSYEDLCNDKGAIALCHNDLAYHNILIDEEEVHFIDFDYCEVNLKLFDLYSFISKIIKRIGFDYDRYMDIINSYRKYIDFSKEEEKLLEILMIYPKDFYSIIDNYYSNKKDWNYESYLAKLKEKVSYKKEWEIFIEKINL